jgi:hypothetical protein
MNAPTTTAGTAPAPAPAPATTPTLRAHARRRRIWIVFAAVLLLGGASLIALRGFGGIDAQQLGAADPSPTGAKAVVEVLRDQGVDVVEASSLERATSAAPGATVLVYDELGLLDDTAYGALAADADRLVVVAPDFAALRALAPGVRHAGAAAGPIDDVTCDAPAAVRAAGLSDGQRLFTIDDDAVASGWTGCFAQDDAYAVVERESAPGPHLSLVGSTVVFENATVDEAGNAALALGLTGAESRLVWYLPGLADAGDTAPTLGELTPGWVSPLLVLAGVVTIAAGVWRGRRLGRLVVEDLPVTVPAGETTEGRARLYAASGDRAHALDQLRIGTLRRLARALRLPRAATADEIAAATAAALGEPPLALRRVLLDDTPSGDRAFVELAGELGELEDRVHLSSTPQGSRPTSPRSPTGRRP